MAIVEFKNEEAWHRLRAQNVGASEVAALFGLSPWTTKWKLYMEKIGKLPLQKFENWVARGRHFEPAIASYAREELDLDLVKVNHYCTDDACTGMGASLDYTLASDQGVPGEIKWVERFEGWDWTGAELTKIPDYYMIQVQQQMGCTGASRAVVVAFVAGEVRHMWVPRSEPIIGAIRTHVKEFWADVAANKEPPVDFLKDADAIFDIAKNWPMRTIELPTHAANLFSIYLSSKDLKKRAEEAQEAAEAELVKMVMDAGIGNDGQAVASCADYSMKMTRVADNPGKIVTPQMVGEIIGARRGFMRTTISKKKGT